MTDATVATDTSVRFDELTALARRIRSLVLRAPGKAGSGHPTSGLSAVELMTMLFFGGYFRYDPRRPRHPNNDRLIFSKGHASPLLYALWAAAGELSDEEVVTYRDFDSPLEGHPSTRFPYTEAATGSLGQGLSIGFGMALNARKLDRLPYRTWVLLGDSEMAEGSQWEAIQLAAHYGLDNLYGVLDANRLGQRGPTMYGHDLDAYRRRLEAFGWHALEVDGHSFEEIAMAYDAALTEEGRPSMIVARTLKGKGVSFLEDADGWHGKPPEGDDLERALGEIGEVDSSVSGKLAAPEDLRPERPEPEEVPEPDYGGKKEVPTRNAYGNALARIAPGHPDLIALDAEVSNSTRAESLKEKCPDRFFEMYIAEQNMAGAGLGLAMRGKIPFLSTFAAFHTRAFDQIRMNQYSEPSMKLVGSHAGVSIGEDGPSQMGLEDLAMFRSIRDSVVLYPCDAMSTERLVEAAAEHEGIVYLRTTRGATPILYGPEEGFRVGGCKVLRSSEEDDATVVAAGVTVHEALAARDVLKEEGIAIRVIDLYGVKPLDRETLLAAADETGAVITVEDHYPYGGIGEAVGTLLAEAGFGGLFRMLAVSKKPRSGTPEELLAFAGIDREAIAATVRELG